MQRIWYTECMNKYFFLKASVVGAVSAALFLLTVSTASAALTNIKPINENNVTRTSVQLQYKNVAAAKKFKFQLWSKGLDRTKYTKERTFFKKRKNRKSNYLRLTRNELTPYRDYKIRYRPVYSGNRQGGWSDFKQFTTQNPSIHFTLTTNDNLPEGDTPYVIIDDSSDVDAGSYAMTETAAGTWTAEISDIDKGDTLYYTYSRNNGGAASYELNTPDDPTQFREATFTSTPYTISDEVTNWRWLTNPEPDGTVVDTNYEITDRSQFIMTMALPEAYTDGYDAFVTSTMQHIADQGFHYVTITHAPRTITAGDPITSTQSDIDTPSLEQLDTLISEARAVGLEIILNVQFPVDPNNAETITADMGGTHEDSYYENYLTRWREAMRDGVELAIEHDVEIVVLDNVWHDMTYVDDDQKAMVNTNVKSLLATITADYTGTITTDYYEEDNKINFYNSPDIDWVGVTWRPGLTADYEPTIAEMYADASTDIETYAAIYATYSKPIFFHQLSVYAWDGAAGAEAGDPNDADYHEDSADNSNNPIDYQEQADAYEALFRVIADNDYIVGASAHDYSYFNLYSKSANIRDRIAEQVWSRWQTLFDAALAN